MALGEIDAAHGLVVGREADLHRLDLQVAGEVIEDLLGVEVPPDRRAVVVGRVGVLAPDDDVGEAEILPIDGVHHGFLRSSVKHFDVQAEQ